MFVHGISNLRANLILIRTYALRELQILPMPESVPQEIPEREKRVYRSKESRIKLIMDNRPNRSDLDLFRGIETVTTADMENWDDMPPLKRQIFFRFQGELVSAQYKAITDSA